MTRSQTFNSFFHAFNFRQPFISIRWAASRPQIMKTLRGASANDPI